MGLKTRLKEIERISENSYSKTRFMVQKMKDKSGKSRLETNIQVKNIYNGKTCFIIGNGPSLKLETRLPELKEHVTFTVNELYKSPLFEEIKPKYHAILDPLYFEESLDREYQKRTLIELIKIREKYKEMKLILPYQQREKCKCLSIDKEGDLYIYGRLEVSNKYNKDIDLCKLAPKYQNVLQAEIYFAIYMGFSRIVLLGLDQTDLLSHYIKRGPNIEQGGGHVYDHTVEEKKWEKKVHDQYDNTTYLELYANTFRLFSWINKYSSSRNIEILNASKETAVDCFEFTDLDSELDRIKSMGA